MRRYLPAIFGVAALAAAGCRLGLMTKTIPAKGNKPRAALPPILPILLRTTNRHIPAINPRNKGWDPSSQVHNIDPRDLAGKKHKESERTP